MAAIFRSNVWRACLALCCWGALLTSLRADAFSNDETFWAFEPPAVSELPWVALEKSPREEVDHPVDVFVQAALDERDLSPQGIAEDAAYFRRLTMLLTGLPSSLDDQHAFLDSDDPNKRQRWTDRWLASYAFGERWASFWLPIARYAEDQAHQVGDNASLTYPNAHLYRQWVIDAFNRDLPYGDFIRFQLAADLHEDGQGERDALGFLGLGPKYYNRGRIEVMADEWEDRVDTVTRSFLGLTVACARCHDHKYDPISTKDYHALAGVFASTDMFNEETAALVKLHEAAEGKEKQKGKAPLKSRHIVKEGKAQDLPVFIRGDVKRKGETVPRRFLPVLSRGEPEPWKEGSGRRQLADAIASGENPLTARVMVNRLWQELFGRGLVSTPSNFGLLGQAPTHGELLDWLAVDFSDHGSMKRTMRALMETAAFQRTSVAGSELSESDPSNQWLGRYSRRRLSFEMWRDTVLEVSGSLDASGGSSQEVEDQAHQRRTLYSRISRLDLNDVLEQFDYPDPNIHAAQRVETTTTTQKLYFLNHPFVVEKASQLADRAKVEASAEEERVDWLYRQLYGRPADEREIKRSLQFVDAGSDRWAALAHVLLSSNEMLYLD